MSPNQAQKADCILVVDDSPDNLFLIQTVLEKDGYDICLASDGKTALEKAETLLPQLILLDVMMPEMDGYETTQLIRQNAAIPSYIPILLITADERSSVVKGLDIGADDFIRKPVDIDELRARVRSLLRLKHSIDEQRKMVHQREDFVSRLTHDLRTPLVAADRMLMLFQNEVFGAIPAEMHDAIKSMSRSNRNLLEMVNTLLEVYRHDAGCKTLNFTTCNLEEIIHEVMQELLPLANERNLALTMETSEALDATGTLVKEGVTTISGDRLELHRVFTNLIGNAIKFTEQGGIEVHLIKAASDEGSTDVSLSKPWVTIEIKDTGIGIPIAEQKDLFERFRPGAHKRSGSGLGLYLVRCIIESHQGTIQLQSEPGQGSVFTIRLPINQQAVRQVSAPA